MFFGIVAGNFPIYKDMYGSDVINNKFQGSWNFTLTAKFELFNFYRFTYEFQFVPMMAEFAIDSYTTAYLEDNCIWSYYNYHTWMYETRIGSNMKQCGFNLRDVVENNEKISFSAN
jgi:hypothetical protein